MPNDPGGDLVVDAFRSVYATMDEAAPEPPDWESIPEPVRRSSPQRVWVGVAIAAGAAFAVFAIVGSLAVLRGSADPVSPETSTAALPPAEDDFGDVRYVNEEHGFEITYPANWLRADESLTSVPASNPRLEEVLALGTYPLRAGMADCPTVSGSALRAPENALADLEPADVLIVLVLGGSGGIPWPETFGSDTFLSGYIPSDSLTCINRPALNARLHTFSLDGRGVSVIVAFGDGVDPETEAETWHILDSFAWTSTPVPTAAPPGQAAPAELEPLAQNTDSFVYLTTDTHLTIIDVDTASITVHELPALAPGDPQYRVVRRGDRLAFYGQTETGPAVFALDPRQPTRPELIDEAWFFIPAANDERVWLALLDPNSPETVRSLAAVKEVTLDGATTVDNVTPPDGRWPVAAVDEGLLFQGKDTLELWDPSTRTFVETLPGPFPVATWHNRIVACGACDEVHLIDLDRNTHQIVSAPEGVATFDGYGGVFSPDGRYVAVPAYTRQPPFTVETAISVALIDFENARAWVIGGSWQPESSHANVAWSSDSEWVFFTNGTQLLAQRPGDTAAYRTGIQLDAPYHGMAAD